MDCTKVGNLIAQLRREKGMTQQQLAERLNISNKTVSKWECGLGCPDLALWPQLSAMLEADLSRLLQGEMVPNRPDVGRIDRTRFYVCPVCGNLLTSTGKADVSCCGRPLEALKPSDSECAVTVEDVDIERYVRFDHPMEKDHYILFAAYVCDDRVLLVRMYPEQSPTALFPLMRRCGRLYFYCTRHGLQKGPLL